MLVLDAYLDIFSHIANIYIQMRGFSITSLLELTIVVSGLTFDSILS